MYLHNLPPLTQSRLDLIFKHIKRFSRHFRLSRIYHLECSRFYR